MQDSLTFLYDLILGVGGSYLGLSFIVGVVDLWKRSSPDYASRATEDVAPEVSEETAMAETPVPLEFPAPSTVEMEAIALPELTTQAQEEQELEPMEWVDEHEASTPPQQLEM